MDTSKSTRGCGSITRPRLLSEHRDTGRNAPRQAPHADRRIHRPVSRRGHLPVPALRRTPAALFRTRLLGRRTRHRLRGCPRQRRDLDADDPPRQARPLAATRRPRRRRPRPVGVSRAGRPKEESGLSIVPIQEEILDLDVHAIPARGPDPAHYHYDVRFLLQSRKAGVTPRDSRVPRVAVGTLLDDVAVGDERGVDTQDGEEVPGDRTGLIQMINPVGAGLVPARAGHCRCHGNGTGQARPLRSAPRGLVSQTPRPNPARVARFVLRRRS